MSPPPRNCFAKWIEIWWKAPMEVSSKQNERWATHAQPTEPLVYIKVFKRFQRRRFLEVNQSETRISFDGHIS
jgi:hypothetical protein